MLISMIVCTDINGGIGIENKLPWDIKEDMQLFIKHTKAKHVVMGANTFVSLDCKPLVGRTNIVIGGNFVRIPTPGVMTYGSTKKLLEMYSEFDGELVVIGGKMLYESMIQYIDKIYITTVHRAYICDTYLELDKEELTEFKEVSIEVIPVTSSNDVDYITFKILERDKPRDLLGEAGLK